MPQLPIDVIASKDVTNPRMLKVHVLPSPDANFLFIYTGIILTPQGSKQGVAIDDTLYTGTMMLNLSDLHQVKFDANPFGLIFIDGQVSAAPVASLASIHGKQFDDDNTWAITAVNVDEENQNLRLLIDWAIQGTGAALQRISYQVNVMVNGRI